MLISKVFQSSYCTQRPHMAASHPTGESYKTDYYIYKHLCCVDNANHTKFSTMNFSVIRTSRTIIKPSDTTPSGTLDLSVIDKLQVLRINVRTLHVFRYGVDAAKVIKEALSKALVPYYPLAGRLKEGNHGELQIDCTGEGVWFVEAHANCNLDVVNYFDNVHMIPQHDLLPDLPPQELAMDPLVLMQVTRFTCEGFVIGLIFCHSICDGLGSAQFLNAVGEFARGLVHPTIAPAWNREVLPTPARLASALTNPEVPSLPPPIPDNELEHISIDISIVRINQLKNEFFELTGKYCSTFDVVVASIWSCRTRVINLDNDTNVMLVFSANTRQFMDPPLPEGFYGNCFFPVTVTISSGWLVKASTAEIVRLIKDAKARLSVEFNKWIKGDQLEDGDNPFNPPLTYTTLLVSEWGRLGFNQIDYGWGNPVHVVPLQCSGASIVPVGIVGLPPTPMKGIRLMTWCVSGMHKPFLLEQMMNLI